jgi:hypothetical protein
VRKGKQPGRIGGRSSTFGSTAVRPAVARDQRREVSVSMLRVSPVGTVMPVSAAGLGACSLGDSKIVHFCQIGFPAGDRKVRFRSKPTDSSCGVIV